MNLDGEGQFYFTPKWKMLELGFFFNWKNGLKMVFVSSRSVHHRLHRGRVRPLGPVLWVLDLQGQDPGWVLDPSLDSNLVRFQLEDSKKRTRNRSRLSRQIDLLKFFFFNFRNISSNTYQLNTFLSIKASLLLTLKFELQNVDKFNWWK